MGIPNTADMTIEGYLHGQKYNPLLQNIATRTQVVDAFMDFWSEYEKEVDLLIRVGSADWAFYRPNAFFEASDEFVVEILPDVKELLLSMFMEDLREKSVQAKNRGFSEDATVPHKHLELTRKKWIALAQDYAAVDVERFVVREMWKS